MLWDSDREKQGVTEGTSRTKGFENLSAILYATSSHHSHHVSFLRTCRYRTPPPQPPVSSDLHSKFNVKFMLVCKDDEVQVVRGTYKGRLVYLDSSFIPSPSHSHLVCVCLIEGERELISFIYYCDWYGSQLSSASSLMGSFSIFIYFLTLPN